MGEVKIEHARSSLRRDKQFANLGHADRALAEQVSCHRALLGIFRKPERIVRLHPVIDHHARQQKPAGIAAHLVDAPGLPRQRYRTGIVIEQAGGASRLGFVVGAPGHFAGEADGAIGEFAQAIAPNLRHVGAVVEPGMQVGGQCRIGTVAADRALEGIEGDILPVPSQIEPRWASRNSLAVANSSM